MSALRDHHPIKGEADFAWRGQQPTRVEALTDMVFAFVLTLLVVSNQPPSSFAELADLLWSFPGFAAAFAMLLLLWHGHYLFFRRYAIADGWTTTLNAALLFLILFFVYPLKYLATMLSRFLESAARGAPTPPMSLGDAQLGLALASLGYAAVFAVFAALYAHALNNAARLDLNERERAITRFSLYEQWAHVTFASLAAACAMILPLPLAPWAGFVYFLIGPTIGVLAALMLPKSRR